MTMSDLRSRLKIPTKNLEEINRAILDPNNKIVNEFLEIVARYGTPEEINQKAVEARALPNLLRRLEEIGSPYLEDIRWLARMRDENAFISR